MSNGDDLMIAKHLFIFKDHFSHGDDQIEGGAEGLEAKYGPKSYSTTRLYIDGQCSKIITDGKGCTQSTNAANAKNVFPNRVGVYLISHSNTVFALAESGATIAETICNYLDSRKDLEINCTMLDKFVLVTCAGADNLKKGFYTQEITRIKLKPQNAESQKHFATKYAQVSEPYNKARQEALNKSLLEYESKGEGYFNARTDKTMVMLACALDKRGAHPKIAAWDDGLYVRKDGRKSTSCSDHGVPGDPVMPHQRLLGKMMIQFTRAESGPGSIRQLQPQEWSDKPS
jgi:hypothetical protein